MERSKSDRASLVEKLRKLREDRDGEEAERILAELPELRGTSTMAILIPRRKRPSEAQVQEAEDDAEDSDG
jgi:hypothetical protein